MRQIVTVEKLEVTQGAIFSNAVAEGYDDAISYGLIITARCDLAHGKFRNVSYVPLVPLNDWVANDGLEIAFERLEKNLRGQIAQKLSESGHPATIIDYVNIEKIGSSLLASDKKSELLVKKYQSLSQASVKSVPVVISEDVAKIIKSIRSELLEYRLAGYYFLESVDGSSYPGFVAILNEIHFMHQKNVKGLLKGFVPDMSDIGEDRTFRAAEFTRIVSVLKSPLIEHLIQQFALIFMRIGIDEVEHQETFL